MHDRRRTRYPEWAIAAVMLLSGPMHVAANDDPYATHRLVAPTPYSRWQSVDAVEPPAPALEVVADSAAVYTLAQLTDMALRNNPRTRQAWAVARFEAAQYGIAHAALMPRADLLLNFTRARVISNTTGAATTEQNRYGPNASLSYVLYDFGARAAEVEAQGYRVLAANLTQNRVLQEVVFQVEQAYFRLMGVEQLVRAGTQALKSSEATLDAARRRHQAGLATIGDVFRSETAVAQAALNLRRAEGEVFKAKGQVASACGFPVTTALRLQPWSDEPKSSQMQDTLESMLKRASTSRPDVAAAQSRVQAARAAVTAAANAGKPSLELNLQASRNYYTDGRHRADGNLIGFNVRIPIFDGWRDEYSVRRAEAQAQQAEATRDQLYVQTELDVWQAYYDLQTAATGITTTATLVQGATQAASVAAARYQSGVGSLLDLLTAQAEETNALVQSIQSNLDWHTALARLNFALGASGYYGTTTP
ncbi:MAG: TolC family protein [Burkholderiales bacterium]|nr:TolC family protein [Burkholderiales bacterium]